MAISSDYNSQEFPYAEPGRFQQLLEMAPDAIVIVDQEGKINLVNGMAEQTFGYARAELIGEPIERLVPETVRAAHQRHRQRYAEAPGIRPMGGDLDLSAVRKDGSRFPVEISLSPLHTPQGTLITAVVRDVTERKQAQLALQRQAEDLARSNAELEQFAYVASHDLQEPLRVIASYAQLLQRRYGGRIDADANDFLEYMNDAARRMQALINDLLAYSRVDRAPESLERVAVKTVVGRVLEALRLQIDDAGARVEVGELPEVCGASGQLHQLFQNLIANAIKFRGEAQPVIEIGARPQGAHILFWVRDNGIGLDPAGLRRVFQIFQRLHAGNKYPGTGIGLAICKKIVERHGGRIWVESAPGAGASFFFTIPVSKRECGEIKQ